MNAFLTNHRVAIVGAGVSGLTAAYQLAKRLTAHQHSAQIVLFEAGDYIGGHTHTVDVGLGGETFGVDTGFLVFNERTYPNLIALFKELGVATAQSEMSFSVSLPHVGLEWAGTDLNSVFAQRRNLCNPKFLRMLVDILRFNQQTQALALVGGGGGELSLGDFLKAHRYSDVFRDWYLLPMAGSIWSCGTRQMLDFPLATFIRFCHNHGLLQVTNRPQWYTVPNGARQYVEKIVSNLQSQGHEVRSSCAVEGVRRQSSGSSVEIHSRAGVEQFDAVIMACHSDQALALLTDASPDETDLLGSIRYQPNRAVLHIDDRLLPKQRRCWAAWNYFSDQAEQGGGEGLQAVGVSYLLNKLQPLPTTQPVIVTLNPVVAPQPDKVLAAFEYAHPVFDRAAIEAQQRIDTIQGGRQTWFAGAWLGYGFHEDGVKAGFRAADLLWANRYGRAE